MAAVTAVVAVGAIAAGAAVAKGMAEKSAAKKAAGAQSAAYDGVEFLDIDKLNDDALAADRKKFTEQFKLQKEGDPTVAAVREKGASNILDSLQDDPGANDLLKQLTQEGQTDSPKRQALIEQLFDSAQSELNAGATLPPEFQAELVRSGLESTGKAGTTGSGAAGVEARTLLGRAGIDLQAHRREQASNLLTQADQLKQNRAAILANTLGAVNNAKGAQQSFAINGYQIGAAGVPQAGLSGTDVANLNVANTNMKNQVTLGRGNVAANLALANGAATSGMIGGVASAATGVIGGVGGAAGGATAGSSAMKAYQTNPYAKSNLYGRGNYMVA